jgi:exosortase family protein XrtM
MSFVVRFVAAYVAGHSLYLAVPDAILRDGIIQYGIVVPAAVAVDLLVPAEAVRARGHVLSSPRAMLEVVRGCDGIGVALLLGAAVAAYPARVKHKLAGLAVGLGLVWAVNLARVVGLYFVVAYRNDWFTLLHAYLVPVAFIVIVAGYFAWWSLGGARLADGHDAAAG